MTASWVFYKTSAKNPHIYPLQLGCFTLESGFIPTDKEHFNRICKEGCKSYASNGSCPLYSPDFKDLARQYKYATVLYFKLFTRHYPPKCLSGKHYVRWSFTESFMPRLLRRTAMTLADKMEGVPLVSGHCIGCRKCSYREGLNTCKNPEKRTFSIESTGVNVSDLMLLYTDSPLLWWDINNKYYIPQYQLRVGIILHNQEDYRQYEKSLSEFLPADRLFHPANKADQIRLIRNRL